MKVVSDGIVALYKGSALEQLTPGGIHSYISDSGDGSDHVVIYMNPSKNDPVFGRGGIVAKFVIEGVSRFSNGQQPINDIHDSIIALYDGDDTIEVDGYSVVDMMWEKKQQMLDDTDINNLLWRYPVEFEIKLNRR